MTGATTTTIDRNIIADADSRRPVQSTTLDHNPTATEYQGGELDSLRSLREIVRSELKAILVDVQRITTPLPDLCKLEICHGNLLREQANLRKLYLAILDIVDEELEDEIEHADLYTYCFCHTKALINH